eukprot:COSAG01_NODE_3886_length_5586_cov_7.993257_2_plen_53_part_00
MAGAGSESVRSSFREVRYFGLWPDFSVTELRGARCRLFKKKEILQFGLLQFG